VSITELLNAQRPTQTIVRRRVVQKTASSPARVCCGVVSEGRCGAAGWKAGLAGGAECVCRTSSNGKVSRGGKLVMSRRPKETMANNVSPLRLMIIPGIVWSPRGRIFWERAHTEGSLEGDHLKTRRRTGDYWHGQNLRRSSTYHSTHATLASDPLPICLRLYKAGGLFGCRRTTDTRRQLLELLPRHIYYISYLDTWSQNK
jgi:hypothetical protein